MSSPASREKRHSAHEKHETKSQSVAVPWYQSPMTSWDEDQQCFSPRHEASTIELFFDLFFVANLATFTGYHAITNRYTFWSYIAFFFILWSTWFHVVCFDARFAFDSVWERICKTVHFCTFAAFALVGYKFAPVAQNVQRATPHWIYRVLCWALFISRIWLALQYAFVTISCSLRQHRRLRLTLPLALNTGLLIIAAAIYGSLFGAFSDAKKNLTGVIVGLYVTLVGEMIGSQLISSIWKKLCYKGTHVGERLGLLGLIIIGEGVIGTTKTITRIMGKNGVYLEGCSLIFCIILILVFMWILYFDNVPKYRFRAIQQQFWMMLHLPLHLAILGIVEGSQHVVLARYIYRSAERLGFNTWYACMGKHLDGQALVSNLTKNVDYYKINESAQGELSLKYVWDELYILGNQSGICSSANTSNLNNGLSGVPLSFNQFLEAVVSSLFQSFEIDIPREEKKRAILVATGSWKVVYTYMWSAIILLLACYTVSSLLATQATSGRSSRIRLISLVTRGFMIAFSIVMLVMGLKKDFFISEYLESAWMLPTIVLQLWTVCWSDRIAKWLIRRREKKYDRVAASEEERDGIVLGQSSGPRRQTNVYGYPIN